MISKELLLNLLQVALAAEEKAVPIYLEHVGVAVKWTGIDEDKAVRVKKSLRLLSAQSVGHGKTVKDLIDWIRKDPRDAF